MSEYDELEKIIREILAGLGLQLYRYTYTGHDINIVVDKDSGSVSVEDCATASRALEKIFDERDMIKHRHNIIVSSPGVERPLETPQDYKRFAGEKVRLLVKEDNKQLAVMGWIKTASDSGVELEFKNKGTKTYLYTDITSGKIEADLNRRK